MLDLLMLTPYLAIAASLLLAGIAIAAYMQFDELPKPTGFNVSRDRRSRTYRGFVKVDRNKLKEAA